MEFLSLRCRPPSFQNILATRSEGRADFAGYSEADPGFLNLYSVWKGIEIGRFVNFSKEGLQPPQSSCSIYPIPSMVFRGPWGLKMSVENGMVWSETEWLGTRKNTPTKNQSREKPSPQSLLILHICFEELELINILIWLVGRVKWLDYDSKGSGEEAS